MMMSHSEPWKPSTVATLTLSLELFNAGIRASCSLSSFTYNWTKDNDYHGFVSKRVADNMNRSKAWKLAEVTYLIPIEGDDTDRHYYIRLLQERVSQCQQKCVRYKVGFFLVHKSVAHGIGRNIPSICIPETECEKAWVIPRWLQTIFDTSRCDKFPLVKLFRWKGSDVLMHTILLAKENCWEIQ